MFGVLAGICVAAGNLRFGGDAVDALWKGSVTALLVMAVAGVARGFWQGDRVEEAEAAGVRVKFGATRRTVLELSRRLDRQMGQVDRRLYDLETAVFKADVPGDEDE